MRCDEVTPVLDAWLDGEFDEDRAAQVEAHLKGCRQCAAIVQDRRALSSALSAPSLYHRAPQSLRDSLFGRAAPIRRAAPARLQTPLWAWLSLAASIVLAGATIWLASGQLSRPSNGFIREAVSAHIRSLMAAHLLDIPSSDRHTVKPWFAGKIPFAPAVPDLAAEGYPLAGGRLDYIAGRPVAAIVYSRYAHTINVFVDSDDGRTVLAPTVRHDRGYTVITWSDATLRSCAVSDASDEELMPLVKLLRSGQTAPAPPSRP